MRVLFLGLVTALFWSCNSNNKPAATGSDAVFADYKISGEEGTENITCVFKFNERNSRGSALFLEPPAAIILDGTALQGDSAGLSGAYYERQVPLPEFTGRHTIVFKTAEGKELKETFTFQPFTIRNEFSESVRRGDILMQLDGLETGEQVRVLLTDTSFATADINEVRTVQNGQLTISKASLRNVASGPVTLHLFKEEERRLKYAPSGGGRLSITYGLSREFELVGEQQAGVPDIN